MLLKHNFSFAASS